MSRGEYIQLSRAQQRQQQLLYGVPLSRGGEGNHLASAYIRVHVCLYVWMWLADRGVAAAAATPASLFSPLYCCMRWELPSARLCICVREDLSRDCDRDDDSISRRRKIFNAFCFDFSNGIERVCVCVCVFLNAARRSSKL